MTKRLAILLTALLTLWALFAPAFASSPRSLKQLQKPALLQPLTADQLEKAASKLDPELLAALQTADPATPLTVIVRLGGQADLSSAADLTAKTARGAFVYQALQAYARRAQAGLRAELATAVRASLAGDIRPFFITNAVAVTARPDLVWHLALRDDVETITPNRIYQLEAGRPAAAPSIPRQSAAAASTTAEWNIAQINADDVWTQYGIDGRGILVANLDSGVDFQHPALVNQYAGNLGGGSFDHDYHWYDATDQMLPAPYDDNGHGTHTMGTTVGGDGPGPFADDIGVAPGATWIAVKAFTYDGYATTADIHEAYEWLLAPCPAGVAPGSIECDPARAPHVVNNSWGSNNGARIEFLPDVQALRAAGIWPEFSAGNNGPGTGSIGSPGSFAEAFATGATDSGDVIASFSSRGPSPLTAEIKPDVVAPGVGVRSSIPGGGYTNLNGTSMAGPHSTGLAALLLSANPALDLDTLEMIIRTTAVDLGPAGPDMDYGYGRIDALAAVQRLVDAGELAGAVRDAATAMPLPAAAIRAQGQGLDLTTTSTISGAYRLPYLLPGPYTVTVSLYGYAGLVTTTTIITAATTTLDLDLTSLPRYTLSGHVVNAISPTLPISGALVSVLDTPLLPARTDAAGFYSLTVAAGPAVVEAAAFSYATGVTATTILTDTVLDFALDPLPPILLVDDDEGDLRSYSPHVEAFYFAALDANGYNYTYWDIEQLGAPDFATIRQYAAVVWFGGEFGRIKDISDAAQAQSVMDYLDLGGRFFYIAQEHTFYYGDDADCDSPRWGGTGPCPFSTGYLGIADWIEDQKGEVAHGVAGNPVGSGLGPIVMAYPPGLTDFTDHITGTLHASLAFSMTDDVPPGDVNDAVYTVISPTAAFKTVYMATPLEAMPANDAADVTYAVMQWFGVAGLAEGLTLSPPVTEAFVEAGSTLTYTLRIRNLSAFSDTFALSVPSAGWQTAVLDTNGSPISSLGPIAPQATADFLVTIAVPPGTSPGATASSTVRATSQSGTPFSDEAQLIAGARMVYYVLDSDQCDSGVHFDWVDATAGTRWDLDDSPPLPEFVSVPLPKPFLFYNRAYDHIWVNDHATILFGDDNLYDDQFPSGSPPIPNPTLTDPNGAVYLSWGTSFWHPSYQPPESAVYTFHDTTQGNDRFIIEYHQYPNLLGSGYDTMQVILDLVTYEITMQYQSLSYHNFAVVGIEDQDGLEGILYVNDQVPAGNMLHDELAIHYGLGQPADVYEATFTPASAAATGTPNGTVDYLLTLDHTGSLTDSYDLTVAGAAWPTTLWDPTFTTPISTLGPLSPCAQAQVGVRVQLPPDTAYVADTVIVQARSQLNTLLVASSVLTTDNAAPAVLAGPPAAGSAPSGQPVTHTLAITNTGNITDVYDLALAGPAWPTQLTPPLTQTAVLPPGAVQTLTVVTHIPPNAYAGDVDTATLTASSQRYPGTTAAAALTTTAAANVAVAWQNAYQTQTRPPGVATGYFITVHNRGNQDDVFALTALGAAWPVSLWNDSFTQPLTQTATLGPDETQRIGVRVEVPATAVPPAQDAVVIRALSARDAAVYDFALLATAVSGRSPAVAIAPAAAWQPAAPGQPVTHTLTLTNTGAGAESYTLAVSGAAWPTAAPATVGPLPPGAAATVEVVVSVPAAAGSSWDRATLRVTAVSDPAVATQADLITLTGSGSTPPPPPPGYRLFLPLIR